MPANLACAYGAHDFLYVDREKSKWKPREDEHVHTCVNCDATYLERGEGPCWRCRRNPEEDRLAEDRTAAKAYYYCTKGDFGSPYEEEASIHQHMTGHEVRPEWI